MFPTSAVSNLGIYVVGPGSDKPFSVLVTDRVPDLALWGSSSGRFFPRWSYRETGSADQDLLTDAAADDPSGGPHGSTASLIRL